MVWTAHGFSSFWVGGPSCSAWSGGAISSMGFMVPQPFSAIGYWSYLEFWAVTSSPRYLGYQTLIVAPEPSVKTVAEIAHSTGCR
jgi:hypothetical protein